MVRGVRTVLVFLVVMLCILQAIFVLHESAKFEAKMQAMAVQGTVSFCINYPPNITGVCPSVINQSTAVENNTLLCQMQAETASNTPINFTPGNVYNGTYFEFTPISMSFTGMTFSLNSSGFMVIYGNQSGIGSYYVPIRARDTSVCPLETMYNYEFVLADINDPPTLSRNLPSKTMPGKSTIVPFTLINYFIDLDDDNMTFSYWVNSSLIVKIDNETSVVTIIAPKDVCDEQLLYFIATDEHNASTDSNMVSIDVVCEPEKPEDKEGGAGGGSCEPEWKCKDWSRCFINNTQVRECTDIHACDPDHLTRDFWKECTYIATCYDGVQNAGETGVDCGGPCPACYVKPEEKNETCSDGIKNQGEMGVDCGGPCPVCKQIEEPGIFGDVEENNLLKISIIIILALGAIAVTYFIFRKEIKKFFARVGWYLTRKKRKQILLKDEEREELLARIKVVEAKTKKIEESIDSSSKLFLDYLNISRTYFEYAMKLKAYSQNDVEPALAKIKNKNLTKAIRTFIERQVEFETNITSLDKELVMYYIQDLRQLILNTSKYERKDYTFIARSLPVEKEDLPLEQGKALLYNATVALEFSDVDAAKDTYYELLKIYEMLNDEGKELVFDELTKLYNYIKYTISWKYFESP